MASIYYHSIPPIYNQDSQVLILGSFPSTKSRELGYNYAHPQNRFWTVMSDLFHENIPDKKAFILQHHLALWDVIASCEITGSSDNSIKNVVVNDIPALLQKTKIKQIFTTGQKAYQLYQKYIFPQTKIAAIPLPSTSPANARFNLEKLVAAYQQIINFLN